VRPSPALTSDEAAFLEALRQAGLVAELVGEELARAVQAARDAALDLDPLSRRIDLLEAHYAAGGDAEVSRRRRARDRFLLQRGTEPVTAGQLLDRLAALAPELPPVALERVGGTADGPLVLRAGEHLAALLDDYEENLETGDIDLRELEGAQRPAGTMVTLRGLVRATNALLERHGVRQRLVALRSDAAREVYLATSLTEAIELARAGHLEDDTEEVVELGGW
jgi:hypothetical protein